MGVDTHLYLNNKFELQDIVKVIERTQGKKVKAEPCKGMLNCFEMIVGERRIFCVVNSQIPTGTVTYLSLHADDEAHKIFKDIANILGGILEYFDSDGKCEMFNGEVNEEDGLPFFVKHAIVDDGIEHNDFKGLTNSIAKFYKECHNGQTIDFTTVDILP